MKIISINKVEPIKNCSTCPKNDEWVAVYEKDGKQTTRYYGYDPTAELEAKALGNANSLPEKPFEVTTVTIKQANEALQALKDDVEQEQLPITESSKEQLELKELEGKLLTLDKAADKALFNKTQARIFYLKRKLKA